MRLADTEKGLRFPLSFIHNIFPPRDAGNGDSKDEGSRHSLQSRAAALHEGRSCSQGAQKTKRWSFSSLLSVQLLSSSKSSTPKARKTVEEGHRAPNISSSSSYSPSLAEPTAATTRRLYRLKSRDPRSAHKRSSNSSRSASLPPLPFSHHSLTSTSSSSSAAAAAVMDRYREEECPRNCYMFDSYAEAAAHAASIGYLSYAAASRVADDSVEEFSAITFANRSQEEMYGKVLQGGLGKARNGYHCH